MIKIIALIAIGIIIGWSINKPAFVDNIINKVKDLIKNLFNKVKGIFIK
jgi:hypothetical protein